VCRTAAVKAWARRWSMARGSASELVKISV
jgi:hypothetical protein